MKINNDYGALVLSMAEFSTLARQPGSAENVLSLVPKVDAQNAESILAEFSGIEKGKRDEYSRAMSMLAAPSQVARVHFSVADELVTRLHLAWRPESKDSVATLALTDGKLAISLDPADKVERMLSNALAISADLKPANLSKTLTAVASMVLIAVMDYLRYARYESLLTHLEAPQSFTRQEVIERLEDASSEDFRWPLLMLDKVFPVPIAGRFKAEEVTAALEELNKAGLLVKNDADGGKPELTLYSLTPAADIIRDSLLHDVSKAALGISSAGADGIVGHEAFLLVRGSSYLWLMGIGGTEGVVASIERQQFTDILQKALTPPAQMPPVITNARRQLPATPAGKGAAAGASACPKCGARNTPGAKFCIGCGATLEAPGLKFCPKCGDPVRSGEKFCDKCGAKLA